MDDTQASRRLAKISGVSRTNAGDQADGAAELRVAGSGVVSAEAAEEYRTTHKHMTDEERDILVEKQAQQEANRGSGTRSDTEQLNEVLDEAATTVLLTSQDIRSKLSPSYFQSDVAGAVRYAVVLAVCSLAGVAMGTCNWVPIAVPAGMEKADLETALVVGGLRFGQASALAQVAEPTNRLVSRRTQQIYTLPSVAALELAERLDADVGGVAAGMGGGEPGGSSWLSQAASGSEAEAGAPVEAPARAGWLGGVTSGRRGLLSWPLEAAGGPAWQLGKWLAGTSTGLQRGEDEEQEGLEGQQSGWLQLWLWHWPLLLVTAGAAQCAGVLVERIRGATGGMGRVGAAVSSRETGVASGAGGSSGGAATAGAGARAGTAAGGGGTISSGLLWVALGALLPSWVLGVLRAPWVSAVTSALGLVAQDVVLGASVLVLTSTAAAGWVLAGNEGLEGSVDAEGLAGGIVGMCQ